MNKAKKAIYWLMGDTGGRLTLNAWNWLWGLPPDPKPETSSDLVSAAETSVREMQQSVNQLARAVDAQMSAYRKAKLKYDAKRRQVREYEREARQARQQGDESAARLAMARAIQLEQLLPQIESRVRQAEDFVTTYREKLDRERIQLEAYKMDVEHLKDMAEIGEALDTIAQTNSRLDVESARSQLDSAKDTLELQYLEDRALAELTDADDASANWEQMTLNEEIDRRLQKFDDPS